MIPEPGLRVGHKYELVRPLGAGGMGAVWVARHTQLDVDVAIKLMAPELLRAPSAVARFEREAKAAAQLKSPHVVHIHDYGVDGGSPYIAMELLEGEDLDALLQREKRLSPARAAEILTQAAKALRAAHDAGIVHRDLKPSNLFLTYPGGDLLLKVLDFGIAKETQPAGVNERTTTGVVLGSPLYMSPEQARGGNVGPPSDLWSLAVVAFEMITGTHPFLGASVGDVIARICGDQLPIPSQIDPSLPPAVDAFFERALRRTPERRFSSARELSDAFAAVAAAHPDHAPAKVIAPSIERHVAETLPAVEEPPRLGRTGATGPLVIAVDTSMSEGPTHPAEPSAIAAGSTASRSSEITPALPDPAPPRAPLRIAVIAVVAAALIGVTYLAARPSPPPSTPAPAISAPLPTAPRPTIEPARPRDPAPIPSAPAPTASASASAISPPAVKPAPLPGTARPRASASVDPVVPARPPTPRIDPFTGLPVND